MSKKSERKAKNPLTRGLTTEDQGSGTRTQRETGARRPKKVRRNRGGIQGVPGSANDSRRCKATVRSTGERCKRAAIKGGTVCTSHGGAAPQVQKSARERLLELADPAIAALSKIVRDENTDDAVRVRAALGICDRIGLGPGQTVTLQASKWDSLIEDLGVEAVQVDRNLSGGSRTALSDGGGGDHSWEDVDQHATDAQVEAWRELDAEDEQPYTTKLDPYDGNTVRGEVVQSRYDAPADLGPTDPPRYWDEEARRADRKPN